MPLEIATQQQDGISIFHLTGRLTYGPEDQLLIDVINKAMDAHSDCLVIDLAGVQKIDSAGWGTLLYAQAQAQTSGGSLTLANLHPAHRKAMRVARLDTIFHISVTEPEALAPAC